jgi:N6-L-threonylcarbamoyladenine synthase
MPTLLAIETSCDETGVAILRQQGTIEVLAQALSSQVDLHTLTGGVVPETAARQHTLVLPPLIQQVMRQAKLVPADLDAIAVTIGPGLMPALSVGVTAARALSFIWQKPLIPVHHLEGHLYAALLTGPIIFPVLALIVSGGHTLLVKMSGHLSYQTLGTTLDDAAGEAFDKVARLLELPYPGGPPLSKLAQAGNATRFNFPRPLLHSGDYNFSFSGLKTAVLYALRDLPQPLTAATRADVAASFQAAAVDTLVAKTLAAAQAENINTVLLTGGVAANQLLRTRLEQELTSIRRELRLSPLELCGDNAVMIGQAALFAYAASRLRSWAKLKAVARLDVDAIDRAL